MLLETLRAYHSVNTNGALSYIYKLCLCCLYSLQIPFNNFHSWRIKKRLIANCTWTIAQLTNVLNYLYDSELNRIVIRQSVTVYLYAPIIDEAESTVFAIEIDAGNTTIYTPNIYDATINSSLVTIYIPATLYNDSALKGQLVADIEQIKILGIPYQIVSL